jgi:hypothetical protein
MPDKLVPAQAGNYSGMTVELLKVLHYFVYSALILFGEML